MCVRKTDRGRSAGPAGPRTPSYGGRSVTALGASTSWFDNCDGEQPWHPLHAGHATVEITVTARRVDLLDGLTAIRNGGKDRREGVTRCDALTDVVVQNHGRNPQAASRGPPQTSIRMSSALEGCDPCRRRPIRWSRVDACGWLPKGTPQDDLHDIEGPDPCRARPRVLRIAQLVSRQALKRSALGVARQSEEHKQSMLCAGLVREPGFQAHPRALPHHP